MAPVLKDGADPKATAQTWLKANPDAVKPWLEGVKTADGGDAMEERVHEILDLMAGKPFIFNLGHGIVPQTPPENVARLVEVVRAWKPA